MVPERSSQNVPDSAANMTAFISLPPMLKPAVMMSTNAAPRCNLEGIRRIFAPPAAAILLSTALLVPGMVLADEAPLVFDHDQSLVGSNFSNRTDLRSSIFSKSNCKGASFVGSDLTNAQLDDANVRRTQNFRSRVVATAPLLARSD